MFERLLGQFGNVGSISMSHDDRRACSITWQWAPVPVQDTDAGSVRFVENSATMPGNGAQDQVHEPTSGALRQHLPDRPFAARVQVDVHHSEVRLSPLKPRKALLAAEKMVFDKDQLDAFWNLRQKVIFEMIVGQVLHQFLLSQKLPSENPLLAK